MQDRKIIIQTARNGPVDISLPISFFAASKTNRSSAEDSGVHVNELPDKGCEASSKRLGSCSECQFDIFDQLRNQIKQSFFPLWFPFNVGAKPTLCRSYRAVCYASLACGSTLSAFTVSNKENRKVIDMRILKKKNLHFTNFHNDIGVHVHSRV